MRRYVLPMVLAVIAVGVLIVPVVLITNAVDDTAEKATEDTSFGEVPSNPIEIKPEQSLYREANFRRFLDGLREKEGSGARLLQLNTQPWYADVQVGVGEGMRGYRYWAKNRAMVPYTQKISGTESIEPKKFPLEAVRPGITERLAAGVLERVRGGKVQNMSLSRGIIDRDLEWSVVAESPTRTGLVYRARADGSGLADPSTFARRKQTPLEVPDSVPADAQRRIRCVRRAQGDVVKLQRCARL